MISVIFALISSMSIAQPQYAYDYPSSIRCTHQGSVDVAITNVLDNTVALASYDLVFTSECNYDENDNNAFNLYITDIQCTLHIYYNNTDVYGLSSSYHFNFPLFVNDLFYLKFEPSFDTESASLRVYDDGLDFYTFEFDNVSYIEDIDYIGYSVNTYRMDGLLYFNSIMPLIQGDNAYNNGYAAGYRDGTNGGYDEGYNVGFVDGKQQGYIEGVQYAQSQDQTALTIFTGICTVAMLPVNMFLTIFNFEVFGINIGGFISSFLTIAIVVIIIRMITGKKSND